MSNLDAINKQLTAATEALAKVDADLAWQATGVAADIAGTIDPTPISDLVSAGVSVRNGDLWGAALSTVSMVPYLGDAVAKPVKAVRATKAIAGLTEKATALKKTITDLTKAKKESEAAAEIAAKEVRIAKESEAAKDAATHQERTTAKKDKDLEDCGTTGKGPAGKIPQVKTACFSAKNLDPSKAKEFSRQLKRQEEALNELTVKEYTDARKHFNAHKRSGTGAEQRKARVEYEKKLVRQYFSDNIVKKTPNAKAAAQAQAKAEMKRIAALHEPDMIAGGQDVVTSMGDRGVNSSIGSQWKNRVGDIDAAVRDVPDDVASKTKMNVKLPKCR